MFAAQDGATPNDKLYVDDVFSAYTYTGDDASTRVITNGIDLAGNGGMVWIKGRDVRSHAVFDTARGTYARLTSNSTDAQVNPYNFSLKAFNSNGFSIGSAADVNTVPSINYVSWTFRKAAKFFDVVTYTGNGSAGQTLNHSLGVVPGIIITKITSAAGGWNFYHRSLGNNYWVYLNQDSAKVGPSANITNNTDPTATQFTVGANANANTHTYVAYLFAHDTAPDGLVQCGSYTGNASATGPTVTLGWEPQYVMVKRASGGTSSWFIFDQSRGFTADGTGSVVLYADLSNAEAASTAVGVNAQGFQIKTASASFNNTGDTYIYLAIRRPNKPPTTGTQVFYPQNGNGGEWNGRIGVGANGGDATNQGTDLHIAFMNRTSPTTPAWLWADRLRGYPTAGFPILDSSATSAEATRTTSPYIYRDETYFYYTPASPIVFKFRRATGVLDIVCDTGTGSAHAVSHSLGAAPELWIRKGRSGATTWVIGSSLLANTEKIVCPSPAGKVTDSTAWDSTSPTSTTLTVGTLADVNTNAATYVTYLWATLAGVSKVGSYTGNGSNQTINCGFTTGARFVMIIRTTASTAQDIFVWDTTRGIVAGNDPHLSLNSTAAEVTSDDSIDPASSGFIVNELAATHINVNGAVYIFLAYA
jgi:hypothetical protein